MATPDVLALVQHLKQLRSKATPGMWRLVKCGEDCYEIAAGVERVLWTPKGGLGNGSGLIQGDEINLHDAALLTAAVNALPALLEAFSATTPAQAMRTSDCTERLAKARETLAIATLKWSGNIEDTALAQAVDEASKELELAAIENAGLTPPARPEKDATGALLDLADILADVSFKTDSGLDTTVAECLDAMHAAAQEIRAVCIDPQATITALCFPEDSDAYVDETTGSVCFDLCREGSPNRQFGVMIQKSGAIKFAIYCEGRTYHGDVQGEEFITALADYSASPVRALPVMHGEPSGDGADPALTPEDLANWLDAKYRRHGEIEDKHAADLIRHYAALPTPATNGAA